MLRRLDAMRQMGQLCDVWLKTDDGCSFMAHSLLLAASSDVLHHMLVAARHETFVYGPSVVPVRNVTSDVLRITLNFIYGVTPTTRADSERLRVGATRLRIKGAYEYCCRRLGENFSTSFVLTGLGNNSLWLADQHPGAAVAASDLSSLTSCMQPPYDVSSFASILSTASVTTDSITVNSVHSDDMSSLSVAEVSPDNDTIVGENHTSDHSHVNQTGIHTTAIISLSSVVAAGGVTDDLPPISLDDVLAALDADGFSDEMSSPSVYFYNILSQFTIMF